MEEWTPAEIEGAAGLPPAIVYVVDDETPARQTVVLLMKLSGFDVVGCDSAAEFLGRLQPDRPGCLLLDIRMPGMSGIDLQRQIFHLRDRLPIIFLTGHGSIPLATQALKDGAFQFFEKPFDNEKLVAAVREAIALSVRSVIEGARKAALEARIESLTRRERMVFDLLIGGASNKAIADQLDISERTVEIHRHRVMTKMQAGSIVDLVRQAVTLGMVPTSPTS